ncbi:MAG: helix-turn-helix transcriptional regulator [Sulfuricella sp.]
MPQTILRLPAVKARTGLSRSTLYLKIQQGTFPKNISLGERSTGWLESEVIEWVNSRITASRDDGTAVKCLPPAKRKTA